MKEQGPQGGPTANRESADTPFAEEARKVLAEIGK
jgi:hypothetical protein